MSVRLLAASSPAAVAEMHDDDCRKWREEQRAGFVFVSEQSKQWKRKCFKR
jgi:hypothetical protein